MSRYRNNDEEIIATIDITKTKDGNYFVRGERISYDDKSRIISIKNESKKCNCDDINVEAKDVITALVPEGCAR